MTSLAARPAETFPKDYEPYPHVVETENNDRDLFLGDGSLAIVNGGSTALKGGKELDLSKKDLELIWFLANHQDTGIHLAWVCALKGYTGELALKDARRGVSELQRKLGPDDLGHPTEGVIRQVSTLHPFGYMALSSFDDRKVGKASPGDMVFKFADDLVEVNLTRTLARASNKWVSNLTPTEYRLLTVLAQNSPRVVEYDVLCLAVLGYDDEYAKPSLIVTLNHLREKLGKDNLGHTRAGAIRTTRDIGIAALAHHPRLSTGRDNILTCG